MVALPWLPAVLLMCLTTLTLAAAPRQAPLTAADDVTCGPTVSAQSALAVAPRETVPIFLKFHKVGSTTLTALLQTLCSLTWWNATDSAMASKLRGRGEEGSFCCGDPFWHQTIHQFRDLGPCSLKRCVRGWSTGLRAVKLFALLREPMAKFVSGLYYFSRWENRKKLFGSHPANFTLAELDELAHASLEVRMKAPVQEYTVILSRHSTDFKWGTVADAGTVAKATASLQRDVSGVGVVERLGAFAVLLALELSWAPEALPCMDTVNSRSGGGDGGGGGGKSKGGSYGFSDLRPDQQAWVAGRMAAETAVYDFARSLAAVQEAAHGPGAHAGAYEAYERRCAGSQPGSSSSSSSSGAVRGAFASAEVRISNFKGERSKLVGKRAAADGEGPSCAVALAAP